LITNKKLFAVRDANAQHFCNTFELNSFQLNVLHS